LVFIIGILLIVYSWYNINRSVVYY